MICFFINDVKLTTVKYILDTTDEIFETTKKDFKSFDCIKYEIFEERKMDTAAVYLGICIKH